MPWCTLPALALMLLRPAPAPAQGAQTYTLRGQDVAVWNLAGTIAVEGGSGDVEVQVTRRGADADRLRVETGRILNRETLRVIYPANRVVFRGNDQPRRFFDDDQTTVYVSDDGTFGSGSRSRAERVEIRTSGTGLEAYADVRISLPRGTTIRVHLAAGEATVRNAEGDISVDVHWANVTTTGTRGTLHLDTGSGDVRVTDAEGEVSLDAGSGSSTLSRIRGTTVSIDAGSGEVEMSEMDVRSLRLDGGSGRARLRGIRAPDIELDVGSGSVDLVLAADVDRLTIDAGSGGVTIGVPESLGATVNAETGSGGIDFDFPMTVTRRSRGSLTGQIGDGRGRIEIDAGSGGIRFRRA
jgi:DUF4097 and DUF4098 domain-containing protein YvlB